MAQFRSKPFGVTKNGDKVDEYIISNPGGLEISVLNYGCVIKNLFVPTKTGLVDVVVGHDTLADYEADFNSSGSTCCGAFVGRYANRIENAEFALGGKTYKLEANNGRNHLHGTFPRKIYDVKMFGDTLLMETESPAGEDGFPGNLKVSVRYILTPDNTLRMDYRVSSDADTIINLTNHTYFNLDGGGNVLGQKLRIYASNYLEGNNETCPTGRILPVAGTPMDFRAGKPLGRDLDTGFYQTTMAGGGFDHCYVLDRPRGASQSLCAWASSDKTGISMKMYTSTFPAAPPTRSSPPRCCGRARSSASTPPSASLPAVSAAVSKQISAAAKGSSFYGTAFCCFLRLLSMQPGTKIVAVHQTGEKDATRIHLHKRAGT